MANLITLCRFLLLFLLVASAYEVNEITNAGTLVRGIVPPNASFTDIRGVEYDPATNNLFVTHLGHSGFFFKIMRLDGTSGLLEESADFNYADDLFLTESADLLVGSRTQIPRVYSQELDQIGALGTTSDRMFVTQYIPEPATIGYAATAVAAAVVFVLRKRKNAGRLG